MKLRPIIQDIYLKPFVGMPLDAATDEGFFINFI